MLPISGKEAPSSWAICSVLIGRWLFVVVITGLVCVWLSGKCAAWFSLRSRKAEPLAPVMAVTSGRAFAPEMGRSVGEMARLRSAMEEKYSPLFERWMLGAPERARILSILLREHVDRSDAREAARRSGINVFDRAAKQRMAVLFSELHKNTYIAIKDEVGDRRFGEFIEFEKTIPERNTASQLAYIVKKSSPLTKAQFDSIVYALAQNPLSLSGGRNLIAVRDDAFGLRLFAEISEEAEKACYRVLDAEQREALRGMRESQEIRRNSGKLKRLSP